MLRNRLLGALLAGGLALTAAACGNDSAGEDKADGPVTLVINGLPPATEKATHWRTSSTSTSPTRPT